MYDKIIQNYIKSYNKRGGYPINNIPKYLTHLTFGYYFNQSVDNLPRNLTHLTFGDCFNQSVDNLPSTLTHLAFGYAFDKKVDLPFNIKYLKLNCNNNQYLIDNLSDGVEELKLEMYFNSELNNLPTSIKSILFHIKSNYNKKFNCLPNFVESIELPINYNKKILKIPKSLNKIICSKDYKFIEDFHNLNVETY